MTTTIRANTETHARLLELSRGADRSLIDTVSDAAEALRRERFAEQVEAELAAIRRDPAVWEAYLGEADRSSVGDGIT